MLILALIAFFALVAVWFVLPGGAQPALAIDTDRTDRSPNLSAAEA